MEGRVVTKNVGTALVVGHDVGQKPFKDDGLGNAVEAVGLRLGLGVKHSAAGARVEVGHLEELKKLCLRARLCARVLGSVCVCVEEADAADIERSSVEWKGRRLI